MITSKLTSAQIRGPKSVGTPEVLIGDESNGYKAGTLMDANAVKEISGEKCYINGVKLVGSKTSSDLHLQDRIVEYTSIDKNRHIIWDKLYQKTHVTENADLIRYIAYTYSGNNKNEIVLDALNKEIRFCEGHNEDDMSSATDVNVSVFNINEYINSKTAMYSILKNLFNVTSPSGTIDLGIAVNKAFSFVVPELKNNMSYTSASEYIATQSGASIPSKKELEVMLQNSKTSIAGTTMEGIITITSNITNQSIQIPYSNAVAHILTSDAGTTGRHYTLNLSYYSGTVDIDWSTRSDSASDNTLLIVKKVTLE